MKASIPGSWLILQSAPECLKQVYPELMQFKTLVGLGYQASEQILMSTLERMSGWVLNLAHPHEPGHPLLLRGALQQGISAAQCTRDGDPVLKLLSGLNAMLHYLYQGLMHLHIHPGPMALDTTWGIYSCSLSGWSKAHQKNHVYWQARPLLCTRLPAHYGLFAGRILAGATLAFFEDQYPAALEILGGPLPADPAITAGQSTPAASFTDAIVAAACALIHRGIWNPQRPPYRLWQYQQQWYLLWPLAAADLQRELRATQAMCVVDDSMQWGEQLAESGCLGNAPQGIITQKTHPHTWKKVNAVMASGALARILDRLQNTPGAGPHS